MFGGRDNERVNINIPADTSGSDRLLDDQDSGHSAEDSDPQILHTSEVEPIFSAENPEIRNESTHEEEDFGEGDTIQTPECWRKSQRQKKKRVPRQGRRRSFVVATEGMPEPLFPPRQRSKSCAPPLARIQESDKDKEDTCEERAEVDKKEEKHHNCLVAKTALIIPFSFGNHRTPPGFLQQKFLDRQIVAPSGDYVKLWQLNDTFPMEVAELSRQFHQMIGWHERKPGKNAWRCRRLRMTKDAYDIIFRNPRLWAVQREDGVEIDISREVEIDNVELDLFPLGTGLLIFHINWLAPVTDNPEQHVNAATEDEGSATEEDEEERARYRRFHETASSAGDGKNIPPLSLEELRTWLYVAKFRHSVPHVASGWTFGVRGDSSPPERAPCIAHVDSLGRRLYRAVYENKPISLNSLGNWLLLMNGENTSSPPSRVAYGGHAYHHSIVVLDSEPSPAALQEYLFHLRHAYGQKNRPPPAGAACGMNLGGSHGNVDRVLVPRLNRYMGISREGIVCMTWSTEYCGTSLDVTTWHKKFQGIYLILCLHAHGERAVLEELSTLAATYADFMQIDENCADITSLKQDSLEVRGLSRVQTGMKEIEISRVQMKELATLVARFTISMSSDDCGGGSEYSEFFSTIRQTFGIPHQRAELREELQDTFALLESGFLEERRRIKMEEQKEERLDKERARKARLQKEAAKHRYETIISTLSSVTIPAVLISSVFGMNVDIPKMEFWVVILVMVGISIIVLAIQLSYLRMIERRAHETEDTLK